jgi:hypothetical protein
MCRGRSDLLESLSLKALQGASLTRANALIKAQQVRGWQSLRRDVGL